MPNFAKSFYPAFFREDKKNHTIIFKLAILKACGWSLTSLACFIYFAFIHNHSSTNQHSALLSTGLMITILLGGIAVILGLWLSRSTQSVSSPLRFIYLLSDVIFLAAAIHFTGGIINPFTSSLLVPIALGITLLPRLYTLTLISLACAIYGYWLMSVDQAHMAHHNFSLHLYGMGINFLLSTVLLTIFISHALESVKKHEKALMAAREKMIKDEQLIGIASLTANTAHALGTPLQTLTLIIDDLMPGNYLEAETLNIIKQQLNTSQGYLQQLVHTAKNANSSDAPSITIAMLMQKIEHHYSLQPQNKKLIFPQNNDCYSANIHYNESLFFAIINLIDNALRAAKKIVTLDISRANNTSIIVSIYDDGYGIPEHIAQEIGTPFIHQKNIQGALTHRGLGLGYYLSNYTIEQNNGKLVMLNAEKGGAITQIHLPIFTPLQ